MAVIGQHPVTVKGRRYETCFLLREFRGGQNIYVWTDSWFVPGVGFVKKHVVKTGFQLSNTLWELMDYKIE
ncbi:MAG: hypothetical protein Kow0037_05290 [Calditrichia bacterium]